MIPKKPLTEDPQITSPAESAPPLAPQPKPRAAKNPATPKTKVASAKTKAASAPKAKPTGAKPKAAATPKAKVAAAKPKAAASPRVKPTAAKPKAAATSKAKVAGAKPKPAATKTAKAPKPVAPKKTSIAKSQAEPDWPSPPAGREPFGPDQSIIDSLEREFPYPSRYHSQRLESSAPMEAAAPKAAKDKAKTAKVTTGAPPSGLTLIERVYKAADEHKVLAPVLLDLTGLSSVTDYFFIAHAETSRQIKAIAEKITQRVKEAGFKPLGQEGLNQAESSWILIDLGEVIVHLFLPESRSNYDLESFWADAPRIDPKIFKKRERKSPAARQDPAPKKPLSKAVAAVKKVAKKAAPKKPPAKAAPKKLASKPKAPKA
jgi:ribosome-associated protein